MASANQKEKQLLFVIRHGERLDNVDYSWVRKSNRPYDPPITELGLKQAQEVGDVLKGKDVECVVSSPFLRCLQTAQQICNSLQLPGMTTCNGIVDVLNSHCGIREQPLVPADNVGDLGISILSYDDEPVPKYPERTKEGLKRFTVQFNKLADKFWPKNIVVVSHGYGVCQAVTLITGDDYFRDLWTDYCGYVEMSRTSKLRHNWTEEAKSGIYDD